MTAILILLVSVVHGVDLNFKRQSLKTFQLNITDKIIVTTETFSQSSDYNTSITLNVDHNYLSNLDIYCKDNCPITKFSAIVNDLEDVPKAVENLINLEELDLSANHIKTLRVSSFSHCKSLRSIVIKLNRLNYIEDNIFRSCNNLEKLDLSYNRLISVPDRLFGNLVRTLEVHKLETAYFSHNQLKYLPIGLPKTLINLYLDGNRMKTVKASNLPVKYLSNIQLLNLSSNLIKSIDDYAFKKCKNLKILGMYDLFKPIPKNEFNKT